MNRPFDVLVAGEINPDLILIGDVVPAFGQVEKLVDSATLSIGSSSAIFACGAARLGLRVAFVGVVGDDVFGNFMLDEMQKRNVDVSHVVIRAGEQTGMSVILVQGSDRAILTHMGLIPALSAESVTDDLLRQSRHLHIASYFLQTTLQPHLPQLFRRARSLGLTISFDPNWDPSRQWRGFDELLQLVDIFLPNENEAMALTHTTSYDSAAEKLGEKCGTVAVKLGAQGALGIRAGKKSKADSLPIKVVDTVGAGDSFDAGFIYGHLQGWSLEKTLRMATICGALSTRKAGGTTAQATLDEAYHELS
jgi:sugar/nucleoside kinase (ribokinase family)